MSWNAESIKNASCLLVSVSKFDFLFSLVICANILGYIKGLSIKLQGRSLDIIEAISMIQSVTVSLKALCNDIDTWHSQWFAFATDTAKDAETDLPSIPRRCNSTDPMWREKIHLLISRESLRFLSWII